MGAEEVHLSHDLTEHIDIAFEHELDGLNQCQCDSQLDIIVRGSPHTALVETMHLK